MIDVLFISPGNNTGIYQDLADNYSDKIAQIARGYIGRGKINQLIIYQ